MVRESACELKPAGPRKFSRCLANFAFVGVLAATVGILAGCARRGDRLAFAAHAQTTSAAFLLFVDGVDRTQFNLLRAAGRLPNIDRLFLRGGVTCERAIASLPPITYVNTATLLTGRWPAHTGIYGNRWFDPRTLTLRDYGTAATFRDINGDLAAPTIHELLDGAWTANIQCHTRRGADVTIDNTVANGLDWALGRYESVDARASGSLAELTAIARREGRWPRLTTVYFPGVDEIGHRYGSTSARYAQALENIDRRVGQFVESIETQPPDANLLFVLVTDHGHVSSPPQRRINLVEMLKQQTNLRIATAPPVDARGHVDARSLDDFDVVAITDADRCVVFHVRGEDGWQDHPRKQIRIRLVNALTGRGGSPDAPEAVGLIAMRERDERVRVMTRDQVARVRRRDLFGVITYRYDPRTSTGDPLGYMSDADLRRFVRDEWHASRAWLAATAGSAYPDFVPQISEYFASRRGGDVVAFAAEDWSFGTRYVGGHGSALASDARVAVCFRGTGVPTGGVLESARLADITPTILEFLQGPRAVERARFDGASLLTDIVNATRAPAAP